MSIEAMLICKQKLILFESLDFSVTHSLRKLNELHSKCGGQGFQRCNCSGKCERNCSCIKIRFFIIQNAIKLKTTLVVQINHEYCFDDYQIKKIY